MLQAIGLSFLLQGQPTPPAPTAYTGGYLPNAQLLAWCKSTVPAEVMACVGYISGVAEAAGNTGLKWPKGNVAIPFDASPNAQLAKVIAYLEAMPRERLSSPASESVYEALVAAWPNRTAGLAPAR